MAVLTEATSEGGSIFSASRQAPLCYTRSASHSSVVTIEGSGTNPGNSRALMGNNRIIAFHQNLQAIFSSLVIEMFWPWIWMFGRREWWLRLYAKLVMLTSRFSTPGQIVGSHTCDCSLLLRLLGISQYRSRRCCFSARRPGAASWLHKLEEIPKSPLSEISSHLLHC